MMQSKHVGAKNRVGKNPLVQRLQQYKAMPAIFRSPEAPDGGLKEDGSFAGPVVQSFVLPPHSASISPVLPAQPNPAQPAELNSPNEVSPDLVDIPSTPPTAPITPSPSPAPQVVQRTEQPATPKQTAVSQPSPPVESTKDGGWSRLKSMMRSVQDAVTGGGETKTAVTETTDVPQPAKPLPSDPIVQQQPVEQASSETQPTVSPQPTVDRPPVVLIPIEDTPTELVQAQADSPTQTPPAPITQPESTVSPPTTSDGQMPSPPSASEADDPISQRLDQIMNLHREKGTIETPLDDEPIQPETPVLSEVEVAVPPPTPETPPIQREASETQQSAAPKPEPTAPEDRNSRRLDQIMNMHREKGTIESTPEMELTQPAATEVDAPTIQREEEITATPETENDTIVPPEKDSVHQLEDVGMETAVTPRPEPDPISTPPTQPEETSIPLQSAWPVQVIDSPTPSAPPPSDPTPVMRDATPVMRQALPEEDTRIREQLKSIPLEQLTDSSVQFIRPRKPRPQSPTQPAQTVQRETALGNGQPESKTGAPVPDVLNPETTVATEIGELPSDLWRLIGEQPPVTTVSEIPATSVPKDIPNEDVIKPQPALVQPDSVQPTLIQQSAAEQAPAEDASPPPDTPAPAEVEEDKVGEEDVDMDELARQVYGEIKDLMTVEWERTRGRF